MSLAVIASHEVLSTAVDLLRHTFSGGNTTTVPAGEVGPVGVESVGDWQVLNGKLRAPATGESVYAWDVGITEYTYEVTLSNISVDPVAIVRCVNNQNFIGGRIVLGGGALSAAIYQRVSGGYTAIGTGTNDAPWANGDTCRMVVTEADVKMYRIPAAGGDPILTSTYTGTQFSTATQVGMRTNGGAVDFDNVWAYVAVPTTPANGLYPVFLQGKSGQYNIGGALSPTMVIGAVPIGSLLVVWSLGNTTAGPTSSAGNTFTAVSGSSNGNLQAWYRFSTKTDIASVVTWTQTGATWGTVGYFVYAGVDATTPFDVTPVLSGSGSEVSTFTGPTLTTVTGNCTLVHLAASTSQNGGTVHNLTEPAEGIARGTEDNQTHVATLVYDEVQNVAGLSTARTFTNTDTGFLMEMVMALRPAGTSGTRSVLTKSQATTGAMTLPVGCQPGDLAIGQHSSGWAAIPPTGWDTVFTVNGSQCNLCCSSKYLTSKDIAVGSVTFPESGGSFPIATHLSVFPGKTNGRRTAVSAATLVTVNPAGLTETVVTALDATLSGTLGPSVVIGVDMWWSMNEGGGGKVITWRIRRDNLAGAVVASGGGTEGGQGVNADTTNGHNAHFVANRVDTAPTNGHYVLTVQQNAGGGNTPIYSDSRSMSLTTNQPGIVDKTATQALAGFTSIAPLSIAAVAGETALYHAVQRGVLNTMGVSRGTVKEDTHTGNGSALLAHEDIAAPATLNPTFTSPGSGGSYAFGITLVYPG